MFSLIKQPFNEARRLAQSFTNANSVLSTTQLPPVHFLVVSDAGAVVEEIVSATLRIRDKVASLGVLMRLRCSLAHWARAVSVMFPL